MSVSKKIFILVYKTKYFISPMYNYDAWSWILAKTHFWEFNCYISKGTEVGEETIIEHSLWATNFKELPSSFSPHNTIMK